MNAAALVDDLRVQRGVELSVDGDDLCCRGPRGWHDPELLADLRAHKPELVRHLRQVDFCEVLGSTVLIRSHRLNGREVWIALSDEAATQILREEQNRDEPGPHSGT